MVIVVIKPSGIQKTFQKIVKPSKSRENRWFLFYPKIRLGSKLWLPEVTLFPRQAVRKVVFRGFSLFLLLQAKNKDLDDFYKIHCLP